MDKFVIKGRKRLSGRVKISGAKNAALAIIPACLLNNGRNSINNVPEVNDCFTMSKLLKHLGAEIQFENNHMTIDTTGIHSQDAPYEHVKKMRASVYVLGPLLAKYGYAKVSKSERSKFLQIINSYLLNRKSLICLFLLIDCSHNPQSNDLQFMRWLGENQIPFVVCFTKTDKLSSSQLDKSIRTYKQVLSKEWDSLPAIFLTSTLNNQGKQEILNFIENTNKTLIK